MPARKDAPARGRRSPLADRRLPWLMVLPAVVLILALSVYPLLFSVWVAFVNYDFEIPGHAFVGLNNFAQAVGDPIARSSLLNTVVLAAADVAVELLLGLALALAMAPQFRGRGAVMSVLIVPLFISPVIVGQLWSLLLQRPFGPTDYVLGLLLGREVTISWLTEFPWNMVAIVVADVWQWTPFVFVILLAGLTTISPQLYEAAALDGAGAWQAFRHITLPQLLPSILLALTFRLLDATKLFDVIYVMTGGGPGSSTYTASFYLYQVGFQQFHLSKATAGGWIFLALTAVLIMALVRRLLPKEAE
ncbi:MAG TPA: sugar ABC transporter permease [Gaiellales bacterium]|nr:sugar ABC transporter permease [Gaiellales bacterium]